MSTETIHPDTKTDLEDAQRDIDRMQPETVTIDMPDVEDIPGQENIRVPKMKQFHDTTISSSDEEGDGLFDDDELDADTDVTQEEKDLLDQSENSMGSIDDQDWKNLALDNKDKDGELLNENDNQSGSDLDIPGANEDDADEELGEEDEENNSYSLGGDRKD